MSPFSRVLLGLFVMVVGFYMVAKTGKFISWFGRIPFAEKKFGDGGSYFFYKLLGTATVFIGIFIATNIISDILGDLACVLTQCNSR